VNTCSGPVTTNWTIGAAQCQGTYSGTVNDGTTVAVNATPNVTYTGTGTGSLLCSNGTWTGGSGVITCNPPPPARRTIHIEFCNEMWDYVEHGANNPGACAPLATKYGMNIWSIRPEALALIPEPPPLCSYYGEFVLTEIYPNLRCNAKAITFIDGVYIGNSWWGLVGALFSLPTTEPITVHLETSMWENGSYVTRSTITDYN
jgi:hypothetical protein